MASKVDEDSKEGRKSVEKQSDENGEKYKQCAAKKVSKDEHLKNRSQLSANAQIVEELLDNVSGEDSESETFQDAVEDLDEKSDSFKAKSSEVTNEEEKEEENEVVEEEERLTPEEKEERKIQAQEFKEKGNNYFKRSEYPEARELYTSAIKICPNDFTKEKSIFYANRAACLVKMEQHKEAIDDCTKALDLDSDYLKVRLRRAQCFEHEDRLEEALEDYQKVFDMDRSSHVAREALMRLPEQIRVKHEKMKEEMMGKLKDLGNVFLRPFGLSTDNFKVQQDPKSGGYSVNFQK
ncbi:tetratricopeptide repeat protein 1-like [Stylophora pistillata]|uniref:tetratricopeptide repeat protein 1-like n=1 Tax=Stylophora pistillata TaxID=50429 RepID=UPI000C057ABD|nr:tetratricopeptide repeat protein 1-like [Stylophora pistillata]